jgi:hypothetical protein
MAQGQRQAQTTQQALKSRETFKFDLEKGVEDLRQYQTLTDRARQNLFEIKEKLRVGGSEQQIQEYRALLMGYMAMEIVLKRSREGGSLKEMR